MAISNLTTAADLLQRNYLPRLRDQIYKSTPIWDRIEKQTDDFDMGGAGVYIGALYQRSEAVGARAELATLPTPKSQLVKQMSVSWAFNYGTISLSGPVMAQSAKSPGTFEKAIRLEMEGIKESVIFDLARQAVFGDGTGKLAMTNGAGVAATSLIVDTPAITAGHNVLRVGMSIDVYTSAGAVEVSNKEITGISGTTLTIPSSTWSDNSFVYRESARNAEMMGLAGIIDDGTRVATFQGLSRSTYTWLKANMLTNPLGSGTSRALTLRLVDDMCIEAEKNGGGGYPTAIYSQHVLAQKYADMVRTDRRYSPKDMTLDGGFRAVEVTHPGGTCPWIMERFVRAGEAWAVKEDDLLRLVLEDISWLDHGQTGPLRVAVDSTDTAEATLKTYQQLAATRCNGHTALKDLLTT